MSLANKVFLVTGGASGIGRATVRKLLDQSAKVYVLDLVEIPSNGDTPGQQISYSNTNISSRQEIRSVFDQIASQNSRLHGLVNCAGILRATDCSEQGDEKFRSLWDINVMGTWITNTDFHRVITASKNPETQNENFPTASIVNLGSMASVRGIPGLSGYAASKYAVLGLSRSFALEWGPDSIRVNTVAPGAVRTPMIEGRETVERKMNISAYQGALKQISEPDEIGDAILYLLGDGSSSITGQVIEINGGWP